MLNLNGDDNQPTLMTVIEDLTHDAWPLIDAGQDGQAAVMAQLESTEDTLDDQAAFDHVMLTDKQYRRARAIEARGRAKEARAFARAEAAGLNIDDIFAGLVAV